jgi:hypothetical protein
MIIADKGISFFIRFENYLIVALTIAKLLQSLNLQIIFRFWKGFKVIFLIDYFYYRQNKILLVTVGVSFINLGESRDDHLQFHQNVRIMLLVFMIVIAVRVLLMVVVDIVVLRVELVVKFFILLIYCKC